MYGWMDYFLKSNCYLEIMALKMQQTPFILWKTAVQIFLRTWTRLSVCNKSDTIKYRLKSFYLFGQIPEYIECYANQEGGTSKILLMNILEISEWQFH